MRVFTGGIATETNTFAPMPTGMATFRDRGYYPAGTHPDQMFYFAGPLWAARLRGKAKGWDLVEGLVAGAQPSGTTTRACYEALREELLADLRAALPVDMVVLGLHGAMVADGYDDCEGDLLQKVRAIVGPGVVVGAELDPHCHLTPAMVDNADLLIAYKEYPHTDVLERALELVDLCAATVEKRVRPVAAMVDCEMIATVHTSREPARSFVDRLQAMEGKDGVALDLASPTASPGATCPRWAPRSWSTPTATEAKAQALARRARRRADRPCATASAPPNPVDRRGARRGARALDGGPVVISDGADNPGGGAASDATFFLQPHRRARHPRCRDRPVLGSARGAHRHRGGRGRAPGAAHRRQGQPALGRPARPRVHREGGAPRARADRPLEHPRRDGRQRAGRGERRRDPALLAAQPGDGHRPLHRHRLRPGGEEASSSSSRRSTSTPRTRRSPRT